MKGKTFTREDLPRITQQRLKNGQVGEEEQKRLDAWLAAQTERYKIVAMDGDTPIIAEELTERLMREHATVHDSETGEDRIDSAVLVQLRNLMQLTQEQRVYVLESFEMNGELVSAFDPPPEAEQPKPKKGKK